MKKSISKFKKKYSKKNFKNFITNAFWAYKQLYKLAPLDTVLLIVATSLLALIPIGTVYLSTRTTDELVSLLEKNVSFIDLTWNSPIVLLVSLTVMFVGLDLVIKYFQNYIQTKFQEVHHFRYQDVVYTKVASLDIQQFEDKNISNTIQKAKDNSWRIRDFTQNSITFATEFISMFFSLIIILKVSPILVLLLIILSIPRNIYAIKYVADIWEMYNTNTENYRTKFWLFNTITTENYIQENKITRANVQLAKKGSRLGEYLYNIELKIRGQYFKQVAATSIFNIIQNAFIYILFIIRLLNREFSIGNFLFYTNRSIDFTERLYSVAGIVVDLFDSAQGIEYVRQLFEMKNAIENGNKKLDLKSPPIIEFKNVSFKYPNTKVYALKNISLTISSNEEIAIVGENGAGKTTLVKLLLRFYDPTSGEILINNIPLKEVNLEEYYKSLGVLFQEYNIFQMLTIKENIQIAKRKESKITMKEALQQADAYSFVSKLKEKTNHKLSKQFSHGINLSTGQKQKIALARMFYRDAPVLILDEPTASIDAIAEHKIFSKIYKFMNNKTVIIISHRFSTVRNAKKIYVIANGTIAEQGSHAELVKLNGIYNKSFSLQAKGYN